MRRGGRKRENRRKKEDASETDGFGDGGDGEVRVLVVGGEKSSVDCTRRVVF